MLTISDHELQVMMSLWARVSEAMNISAQARPATVSMSVKTAPPGASHLLEDVARRWYAHMLPRWVPVHAKEALTSLERDVFPALGGMALHEITAPMVLKAMRAVEARGAVESARRLRQRVSMIFTFAIAEGIADSDPAAFVGKAMAQAAPKQHHPALLEIQDARGLVANVAKLRAAPATKAASLFLALTAVRFGPIRLAQWSEIEDLDGKAPLWRVPAAHMKLAAAKKKDAANCHLVPLSRQAVAVLRAMAPADREPAALIFSGPSGAGIGESSIGSLYKRTDYADRHVPHGWRATFSTVMNEHYPEDRAVIDLALAHSPKDKVESAYNRAAHLERRRTVFQNWGDLLVP